MVRLRDRKKTEKRKVCRRGGLWLMIPTVLIVLAFTLVMLSPLGSCTVSYEGCIGEDAAMDIAVKNARISAGTFSEPDFDFIELDGRVCYKLSFTAGTAQYTYIIDAYDGSVVAYDIDR